MTDLTEFVTSLVHEPTQTEGPGVDLTVAAVHRVETPGSVDFGGGEFERAETRAIVPEKRDPDDDYGWWTLSEGDYLLAYNESLAAERAVVLQPRVAVVEQGAFHPTLHVRELPRVPLTVGGGGLRLKENARVSTLLSPATDR